jgi:putative oxidoreductase
MFLIIDFYKHMEATRGNSQVLNVSLLILRLIVGVLLFVAGAGKVFGWFGGFGIESSLQYYAAMGIVPLWAYVSMYTELIGGLFLILGFFTRVAGFFLAINMFFATIYSISLGAILLMPLIFLLIILFVSWKGPGKFSLDFLLKIKM